MMGYSFNIFVRIYMFVKALKGSLYSWKGVINLEETHGRALK